MEDEKDGEVEGEKGNDVDGRSRPIQDAFCQRRGMACITKVYQEMLVMIVPYELTTTQRMRNEGLFSVSFWMIQEAAKVGECLNMRRVRFGKVQFSCLIAKSFVRVLDGWMRFTLLGWSPIEREVDRLAYFPVHAQYHWDPDTPVASAISATVSSLLGLPV